VGAGRVTQLEEQEDTLHLNMAEEALGYCEQVLEAEVLENRAKTPSPLAAIVKKKGKTSANRADNPGSTRQQGVLRHWVLAH
jgi:hypothetical protein